MMKRMPVFVSHFTKDSPYEKIVKNLIRSLKKFNLEYGVEATKHLGSWRANSNYCAVQVQKMLNKYEPRPILRLDSDAVVQRYPKIFEQPDFNPDIATVIWYGFRKGGELLGGTLYFANTKKSRNVVNRWVELCKKLPKRRNPDLLQKVIWNQNPSFPKNGRWPREKDIFYENIRFQKLPLSYCKIFDHMTRWVKEPVIEHFQASRKCKKVMDKII